MTLAHDPFTIRCGTLLDGVGGRQSDVAVSVAGGRIQFMTPWSQRGPGAASRLIDAGSLTVLPGLIESHDHLAATPRNLAGNAATPPSLHVLRVADAMRATLQAGFTTVRDMGGLDLGMRLAVESGELAGPRVLICLGILTQTSGLSDFTNAVGFNAEVLRLPGIPDAVCDGVDQVRAMTRRMIRGGADFIKIATTGGVSSRVSTITTREFSFDEVKAVVDEARAFNRPVAAHAYAGEGLKNALRAGVRTVEHLGPLDDEDIATIVRQGTYLVPTLSNMAVRLGMEAELPPSAFRKRERSRRFNAKRSDAFSAPGSRSRQAPTRVPSSRAATRSSSASWSSTACRRCRQSWPPPPSPRTAATSRIRGESRSDAAPTSSPSTATRFQRSKSCKR